MQKMGNKVLTKNLADEDFKLHIHPESMVELVYDMRTRGMSDIEITAEIEKIKESILLDYKNKVANGEIDEDDYEDVSDGGCGDPTCPSCGKSVTYH